MSRPRLFLKWKTSYGSANQNTWSARLGMVTLLSRRGSKMSIPARRCPQQGSFTYKFRRARPFIFSLDTNRVQIVRAASHLPSAYGLRAWTCSTVLGLIAVTGLRINEASEPE